MAGARDHFVVVRDVDALGRVTPLLLVLEGLQLAHHFAQIHFRSLLFLFFLFLLILLLFLRTRYALLHHRKQVLVFDSHLNLGIDCKFLAANVVRELLVAVVL